MATAVESVASAADASSVTETTAAAVAAAAATATTSTTSGGHRQGEDHQALTALQQHLQLEAHDGRYLTRQEILLLELFHRSVATDGSGGGKAQSNGAHVEIHGGASGNSTATSTAATSVTGGGLSGNGNGSGGPTLPTKGGPKLTKAASVATSTPSSRQATSDRARVQNFLAQRQNSIGGSGASSGAGIGGSGSSGANSGGQTPRGGTSGAATAGTGALSAMERAKLLMAKKAGGAKPLGSSTAVKRVNPLADILKGGSGSVVGGVQSSHVAKRPRTKSDLKPGEIRLNGGRSSIQLPVESFLRSDDWEPATGGPLDLVLPEVAFATNNTLIIHATMPPRSMRFCFNISTQSSMLSGAPYPGTVLYHFNPRRARGGQIIQNSNIDGRWGCSQPLPRCPITFGEPFTLRLTIVPSGFLVFIEEIYQDEFKHRVPIREGENLVLTVPTRDENGNPEGVIVHSVWWGHAEPPANMDSLRRTVGGGGGMGYQRGGPGPRGGFDGDRSGYRGPGGGPGGGGGRFHTNPHPFEVYVGNLPPGTSREELSFLFQYLGYETVRITARGFGFVTLRSAEDMHRAVEDLDGREFNGMKLKVSVAMAPK